MRGHQHHIGKFQELELLNTFYEFVEHVRHVVGKWIPKSRGRTFSFFLHGGVFSTPMFFLLFIVAYVFKVPQLKSELFQNGVLILHFIASSSNCNTHNHFIKFISNPSFVFVIWVMSTNNKSLFGRLWHCHMQATILWQSGILFSVYLKSKNYF